MIEFSRHQLISVLEQFNKVTSQKSTMPILSFVAIKKQNNTLKLDCSNLEFYRSILINDIPGEDIELCASNNILLSMLSTAVSEKVKFEIQKDSTQCTINMDQTEFNMPFLNYSEFPVHIFTMDVEPKGLFTISSVKLLRIINKVLYGASTDDSRYALNCVFIKYDHNDKKIQAVATDGGRLARYCISEFEIDNISNSFCFQIPLKTLDHVLDYLQVNKDKMLKVELYDKVCKIEALGDIVYFRLLDDSVKFPDYEKFVPDYKKDYFKVEFDKDILTRMLTRAQIIYDKSFGSVIYYFDKNKFKLDVKHQTFGNLSDMCDIKRVDSRLAISAHPKFLLDYLNTVDVGKIDLYYKDEIHPLILDYVDENNHNNMGLIMPFRI